MNPCLTVNLDKIESNARVVKNLCASFGIEVLGVTKVFCGEPVIALILAECGISSLGDSRLDNIERYRDVNAEKWLLRMPCISDVRRCVELCDVSLNSELETLKALNREALRQKKKHKVVLMADLGDLREGCIDEDDFFSCADFARKAEGLELFGVGTNLTCFSFVQSDPQNLSRLVRLAKECGSPCVVSGGNSAAIKLMTEGGIPEGVNHLRLGESILFGRERADFTYLEGTVNDAFIIEAEVIECKEKPSMPIGTIGKNSYGVRPAFTDKGKRLRAICSMGRQDVDEQTMWPIDAGIEIVGASSDHFVADVTEAERVFKAGDKIAFRLGYFATMRAFTSSYVEKRFAKGCIIGSYR